METTATGSDHLPQHNIQANSSHVQSCTVPECGLCARTQNEDSANQTQASNNEPAGRALWGVLEDEHSIKEVRITKVHLKLRDFGGEVLEIPSGDLVDVSKLIVDEDFATLRTKNGKLCAIPLHKLAKFSELYKRGSEVMRAGDATVDFAEQEKRVHRLFVVNRDIYAAGTSMAKAVLKPGLKVLLFIEGQNGLCWFRTTNRKIFVLGANSLPDLLNEVDIEVFVRQNADAATGGRALDYLEYKWHPHTHHNPNLMQQTPAYGIVPDPIFLFPCTRQGLPVPPVGYVPPSEHPSPDALPFGYYTFATSEDRSRADKLGFPSPSAVVYAAHHGHPAIGDILLNWIPGEVEGSQGAGFGPCNAYIHDFMIASRREFWFDMNPVPMGELPIYTGTDEFWIERPGANASHLDGSGFTVYNTYYFTPVPSVAEIEEQILARQGAQVFKGPRTAVTTCAEMPFQSWQDVHKDVATGIVLHASHRQSILGYPLANCYPIDSDAPLHSRTSFHSDFAHCGWKGGMHAINYQLRQVNGLDIPDFISNPTFPLLNADGGATWTLVLDPAKKTAEEVLIKDYPFLPAHIASDEDPALINAFHALGAPYSQIVARMDEETRPGPTYLEQKCREMRVRYAMLPEGQDTPLQGNMPNPITQAHEQLNSAGGRIPGSKLPGLPKEDRVKRCDTGEGERNWVDYPAMERRPKQDGNGYRGAIRDETFEMRKQERARVINAQFASRAD